MFDGARYVTPSIMSQLPLYMQNMLWSMIETMPVSSKDYLQIFELSVEQSDAERLQKLIHIQEQPTYKKEYYFPTTNPINARVFVIDNSTHCTMLLASEY